MIEPKEVSSCAKRKKDENIRFRSYLKTHADEETLDKQFLQLHQELFDGYECGKCRNCCKMYHGYIPMADLKRISNYLNLTEEQLIHSFLECNEITGNYETKHMPCDFLMVDGTCMLGENKPKNCRDYPYTNRPERLESLYSVLKAVEVCPVVYEIWERLKLMYGFRVRKK